MYEHTEKTIYLTLKASGGSKQAFRDNLHHHELEVWCKYRKRSRSGSWLVEIEPIYRVLMMAIVSIYSSHPKFGPLQKRATMSIGTVQWCRPVFHWRSSAEPEEIAQWVIWIQSVTSRTFLALRCLRKSIYHGCDSTACHSVLLCGSAPYVLIEWGDRS